MFLAACIPVVGYLLTQREFIRGLMGRCVQVTPGLPALDDILGGWLDSDELVHLHSLRNQWGQAHVNPT